MVKLPREWVEKNIQELRLTIEKKRSELRFLEGLLSELNMEKNSNFEEIDKHGTIKFK